MTTTDTAAKQAKVDTFNADNLPGAWVRYWTGTRQDPAKYGQTRSKAELLSGHTPVVWVTGHGACIALTHVDPIPGQPDGVEWDSHDLPKLAGAAERVGDYIAANGDGIYDVIDGHPLYARDMEALRRAADHVWAGEQLRDEVEKLRAELAKARADRDEYADDNTRVAVSLVDVQRQLTAANRRADGLEADLRSAIKGNTAWANQTAAKDAVIEAAKAWRAQFGEWGPLDSADTPSGDLTDAVDALPNPLRSDLNADLAWMVERPELDPASKATPTEATR